MAAPAVDDTSQPTASGRLAAALAVVAGVVLRLYTRSPMWLDEALTVNIAGVGLGKLQGALERDGAPPLYYALLWGWMRVFGTSDVAIRLLSAVFSVATLWFVYRIGKRIGGAGIALAALVLVATSPFAIRYATEARMYSLVMLLVCAGWLALINALERPAIGWLVALGTCAGALVLTHYWGFFLLAATGAALLARAWAKRPASLRPELLACVAIAVGTVVLFAPWIPTFLYQGRHTGAPWGTPPAPPAALITMLVDFGGGIYVEAKFLTAILVVLVAFAIFGRRGPSPHLIELDLRTVPGVRAEVVVALAAVAVAVTVGLLTGSAFASRYTAIAFPILVVAAAYGTRALPDRRAVAAVVAVAALVGLVGGVRNVVEPRTQAGQVADAIRENGAERGDVVAYCPDQLGPDVHRELQRGLREYTFPDLAGPRFVNWVDYRERMERADPAAFAKAILDRAGSHDVYLVWMPGYRTLSTKCETINSLLAGARPGARQLVEPDRDLFEKHVVWVHPAP